MTTLDEHYNTYREELGLFFKKINVAFIRVGNMDNVNLKSFFSSNLIELEENQTHYTLILKSSNTFKVAKLSKDSFSFKDSLNFFFNQIVEKYSIIEPRNFLYVDFSKFKDIVWSNVKFYNPTIEGRKNNIYVGLNKFNVNLIPIIPYNDGVFDLYGNLLNIKLEVVFENNVIIHSSFKILDKNINDIVNLQIACNSAYLVFNPEFEHIFNSIEISKRLP